MKPLVLALALMCVISHAPVSAQTGSADAARQSPTDLDRVKVGQPAPDFILEDSEGKKISLADYRGNKNVVLVFYRGHW